MLHRVAIIFANFRNCSTSGELFLDNGAYTANIKNFDLSIEKVIFIQEKLNPSKTIPLDYPFKKLSTY